MIMEVMRMIMYGIIKSCVKYLGDDIWLGMVGDYRSFIGCHMG